MDGFGGKRGGEGGPAGGKTWNSKDSDILFAPSAVSFEPSIYPDPCLGRAMLPISAVITQILDKRLSPSSPSRLLTPSPSPSLV